ncbi:MAG TPA: ABC transporter substrate-binding protein [Clostridiales bacterium]|nr:ABC transporter substrate-binding protein [Clostridiales bacterium]
MKKRMILIAILIISIATLAGCKGKKKNNELEKVTIVLDWVPNTNHTGMYVALENGYYKDEGLEVEIIQPTAGGSADLIAAGQGEFGISYQEQVTYARTATEPLPVKAIAAIIQHNTSGFASPAAKNITSAKEFEGKKYGGWGSAIEAAMLKGLMEIEGGDYNKLDMIDIDASDFFASVENHVDFTWIYYGWDGVAAELKDYDINFIKLQDVESALDFYTPVIIAQEKLLKDKPKLAKKFLKATSKGYEYAINNPEKAGKLLIKHVPELDEKMVIASQEYLAKEYKAEVSRWGEMKESVWSTYGDWMFDNNLLENKLNSSEAFTNDYLPKE